MMNYEVPTANRQHKSTVFRTLFSEREKLLELYNAVNGTDYQDPDALEINTLDNAVYMKMENDVSFLLDFRLNLYEHQSTVNPNMPLRMLFYITEILRGITLDMNLYSYNLQKIPTPRFVVFYNGTEEQEDRLEYRLSGMFEQAEEIPQLELIVVVLNVNAGRNTELMKGSRTLSDYAEFVRRIRENSKTMERHLLLL